jgi:hypothetical protein
MKAILYRYLFKNVISISRGDCVVGRREILYAMHFTRSKQDV